MKFDPQKPEIVSVKKQVLNEQRLKIHLSLNTFGMF